MTNSFSWTREQDVIWNDYIWNDAIYSPFSSSFDAVKMLAMLLTMTNVHVLSHIFEDQIIRYRPLETFSQKQMLADDWLYMYYNMVWCEHTVNVVFRQCFITIKPQIFVLPQLYTLYVSHPLSHFRFKLSNSISMTKLAGLKLGRVESWPKLYLKSIAKFFVHFINLRKT